MAEKLRIAVIGLGNWGANVLKTLNAMPDVEIAWTAGSKDWQKKVEKTVGSAERTHGVAIAVPAPAQPTIARLCLDQGLPVFMEKPFALDPTDARLIRNRASMMGDLPVVVDHVHLFSAEYEALRVALTGKSIRYVETFAGNWGPFRAWGTGFDTLHDYGPHEMAFALDLIGVPDDVAATRARSRNGDDHIVRLTWKDGTWANLSFGNCFSRKTRMLFVNADDVLWKLDATAQPLERLTCDGKPVPVIGAHVPPLERALKVWLEAIRGDRRDERVGCDLAVKVTELLFRVTEALRASDPGDLEPDPEMA